ncbi:NUDIX hydrolase [Acrocarpospora phusangensis]|uniref:NUDIX hydrolase n=1 Tax=Acrocarpospora phusangensis TaxID=1070424 RepID=A0A919Q644_9ACTN|nr:NUDIX domain-containing protein [Acrocarpospora phusangensis]GIH22296.1 NUDIX hydrolase [Acrocarpospora phusangensis]
MAQSIDYYDVPDAPAANSLVPSVNVVVANDAGDILMIRGSDGHNWVLPGGTIDLGESLWQAAVRRTREETGIECAITRLVGTYTDPRHVTLFPADGETRQEFSIVLAAHALGGRLTEGSDGFRWVPRDHVDGYSMDRATRFRIGHYLAGAAQPYIG